MAPQPMRRAPSSGGGRYVLATFVVLLIVALMASIVGLVLYFDPYVHATNKLNETIEKSLYQPLREKGVELARATPSAEIRSPYGVEFFKQVQDVALLGTRYDEMVKVAGFEPDSAVDEMNRIIAGANDVSPRPPDIKKYVDALRRTLAQNKIKIDGLERDVAAARQERDQVRDERDLARKLVAQKVSEGDQKTREVREQKEQEINQLKSANDRLAKELNDVRKERNDLAQQVRKVQEDTAEQTKKMKAEVERVQKILAAKQEEEKKEVQGQVQHADMMRKFAVVGLGAKDGVKLGDTLEIFRIGRGGVKIKKAVAKVVRVEDLISQVDLFELADEHPVVEGDIVIPAKKSAKG
jgi:hypothetical protein